MWSLNQNLKQVLILLFSLVKQDKFAFIIKRTKKINRKVLTLFIKSERRTLNQLIKYMEIQAL